MSPAPGKPLTAGERDWLLLWARRCIRRSLASDESGDATAEKPCPPQGCRTKRGAFVSLSLAGQLRGCIGTFSDSNPLYRAVADMAAAAATRDPRFAPLPLVDLGEVGVEISVLGPRRIIEARDIEIGRHGLWISNGAAQGVLLPQVATAQGWDVQQFLQHTCRKANLPPHAWQESGTLIEGFEAEVFADTQHH